MLGADRLGYWAKQYGFGSPTGVDLPGEVSGIVPTNAWKQDALGAPMFAGETYQAGIGQGYDAVTPLQLINAYAALANGGTLYQPQIVKDIVGPDGTVVRPFEPKVLHKLKVKKSVLRTMRNAARNTVAAAPHLQPGRSPDQDRGQVRHLRVRHPGLARAACRTPPGSSASRPATRSTGTSTARTPSSSSSHSPMTRGPSGNAATEIVKYFMQLHYDIKKDYRLPALLKRGNFYTND